MGKSLKSTQRTIAAVSVASMALLNVGIMAPAAHGAATNGGVTHLQDGTNDPAQVSQGEIPEEVQLKITKLTPDNKTNIAKGQEGAYKQNGLAEDPLPSGAALQGVKFKIYKIAGLDLTKNADWVTAQKVSEKFNALSTPERKALFTPDESDNTTGIEVGGKTYKIDSNMTAEGTTNENGVVKFQVSGDGRGLYIVSENVGDNDDITVAGKDDPVKGIRISKSAPFVVALPMTDQSTTTTEGQPSKWLNIVNLYPKNSETDVQKTVTDTTAPGSGNTNKPKSPIEYTVKTDVPHVDKELTSYQVVDPLDSRLTFTGNSTVELLDSTGSVLQNVLEEGDYTVTPVNNTEEKIKAATNDNPVVGTWVTLNFTKSGLKKLSKANVAQVKWVVPANVKDTSGKTDIKNEAFLIPPNTPADNWKGKETPENPTPKIPSNEVVTKYGKVTFKKIDEKNKALSGAEFKLYLCNDNMEYKESDRVTVDNQNTWTSGTVKNSAGQTVDGGAGDVVIDGLQLNDFKNDLAIGDSAEDAEKKGAVVWNKDKPNYCLVETKAPAGYELLPKPIKFQLLQNTPNYTKEIDVKNVPNNGGFNLPLTGGKGIFGLVALGALLVLGSIGYIFLASRRRQES